MSSKWSSRPSPHGNNNDSPSSSSSLSSSCHHHEDRHHQDCHHHQRLNEILNTVNKLLCETFKIIPRPQLQPMHLLLSSLKQKNNCWVTGYTGGLQTPSATKICLSRFSNKPVLLDQPKGEACLGQGAKQVVLEQASDLRGCTWMSDVERKPPIQSSYCNASSSSSLQLNKHV